MNRQVANLLYQHRFNLIKANTVIISSCSINPFKSNQTQSTPFKRQLNLSLWMKGLMCLMDWMEGAAFNQLHSSINQIPFNLFLHYVAFTHKLIKQTQQIIKSNNKPINHQQKANVFALLCWLMVVLSLIVDLWVVWRAGSPINHSIPWIQFNAIEFIENWIGWLAPLLLRRNSSSSLSLLFHQSNQLTSFNQFINQIKCLWFELNWIVDEVLMELKKEREEKAGLFPWAASSATPSTSFLFSFSKRKEKSWWVDCAAG